MISVMAYYDGNKYVMDSQVVVKENQKVIITILDDFIKPKRKTLEEIKAYMGKGKKSVPDGVSAVDYVRSLREDK